MNATLKYIHISPRKTRLVSNIIEGKGISEALNILSLTNKAAARILEKILKSAIANAQQNNNIKDVDMLVIDNITVNNGPIWKRSIPRARGRATPIRKRTSHITVNLVQKQ